MNPLERCICADGVTYQYQDSRVLFSNLNIRVAPGGPVAITGPSGTGKSTLLALLGGALSPTAGEVRSDYDASEAAWIIQSLPNLGARTVIDNAALYSILDGEPSAPGRTRAALSLEHVGLLPYRARRARTLSGGELQRLAVARAVSSRRPLILADEPTNQLDRANAAVVMKLLFDTASRESRLLVVVTHDLDALPRGCVIYALTEHGLELHGDA